MITRNNQKNKSTQGKASSKLFNFEKVQNLDIKSRDKIVQRLILAVQEFINTSQEKNSLFGWNNCPWPVQFLPVMSKFYKKWGEINAVNPALSGFSGLMGMSKMEMNNRLNEKFRPRNLFFAEMPNSRDILVQRFRKKYDTDISFPVIFKPNVGERASGVSFIREDQVDDFLAKNKHLKEIIFEEFVQTELEFGLSWVRDPQTKAIEIISLVQKNTPKVHGNGQNNLKELIVEKCAALCLEDSRQEKILAGFSAIELTEKINGEKSIVRTASVSYGTAFEKISLSTVQEEKLQALIIKLLNDFTGIYVGRFDIKADNVEDILTEKCWILEMNGVGGMPLEIYDNAIEINKKYQILFNYFSRIFDIAEANIANKKGRKITKFEGLKNLSKNFFGKNKTQELPEIVWGNLKDVFKISLKGHFLASDLGKALDKFRP